MKTNGEGSVPKQGQPPAQGSPQPIQKTQPAQPPSFKSGLKDWFAHNKQSIESLLPAALDFRRFARLTVEVLAQNPKLAAAQPLSLMLSIMRAAADGLEPDGRKACIVPYNDKGTVKAQYQRMYGGVVEHCYRTGQYSLITGDVVHANDFFEYERGFPMSRLSHKPASGDRGDVIGYWAGYRLVNGGYDFVYLPKETCLEHGRKYSKNFANPAGPWQTQPDAMCLKTVLLKAVKYAPQSVEDLRVAREVTPAAKEIEEIKPGVRAEELVPLAMPSGDAVQIVEEAEVVAQSDDEEQGA